MAEDGVMLHDEDDDMEIVAAPGEESEEDEDDMQDEETTVEPEVSRREQDAAIARRRAIQEIMRDPTITGQDKAHRIQALMSGGRTVVAPPPAPVIPIEPNAACVHYERNCSIVAPCCNRVFGCRICHDELSPSGHPPLDRFTIREVVCKNCNTRQNASNQCVECQTVFGEYHCGTCNLWMSMVCRSENHLTLHNLTLTGRPRSHSIATNVDSVELGAPNPFAIAMSAACASRCPSMRHSTYRPDA